MSREFSIDFGEITFSDKRLTEKQRVENKMVSKIEKHRYHYGRKISNDVEVIRELVHTLPDGATYDLISKAFDSPTIVLSFLPKIKRLFIATWAITPAGINALMEISNNGVIEECWVMLDMTHSYKWIFESEAYQILKGRVKFKFLATHAKFICYELTDGTVMNFIGSMNFSNNPRFENIQITKDRNDFDFYSGFILNTYAKTI